MELSITLFIVILTCIISITGFSNQKVINDLIFYGPAIQEQRQYFRFISHGFIHADIGHLAFNMIALYSFGEAVENPLFSHPCVFGDKGKLFYIFLYLTGLIIASLPDYFKYKDNYQFRSLGASGAVSSVIFASIVLLPQIPIRFFFIPIDIPGYIFGLLYLIVSAYLDRRGGGRINHGAHFWGAAYGVVFTLVLCSLFAKMNVYENFIKQIQSMGSFKPFICDL